MTRAALYARVSTAAQRDAQTIDGQLRTLRAFIAAQQWQPAGEYVDDGRSASTGKLDKRDAFARLVRDAEARAFDILVVFDIDRLTRTSDMQERAQILGPFQRAGIEIVTPTGSRIDLRTMLGSVYALLKAEVAAEETRVRIARSIAGRERVTANGGKPCGVTPFGLLYDRAGKRWAIDEQRANLAREILRRVLQGESCLDIADDFAQRGEPAMRGEWHRRAVWRIATSEHLTGRWLANKRKRMWVDVPAIVDRATFERAQDTLSKAQTRGLRKTKHVYLLEGIAVCGECGSPLGIRTARPGANGYMRAAAYVCRSRLAAEYRLAERCAAPCLPVVDTDARVWDTVAHAVTSEAAVEALRSRLTARAADRRDWQADVKRWESKLAKAEQAAAGIAARFRRGLLSDAAFDLELAAAAKERRALEAQLEAARDALRLRAEDVDADALIAELRAVAEAGSPEERRAIVRRLVPAGTAITRGVDVDFDVAWAAPGASVSLACSTASHENADREPVRLRVVAKGSGRR